MNASCTSGRAISIAIFASSCLVISRFASGGAEAASGASAETITLPLRCERLKAGLHPPQYQITLSGAKPPAGVRRPPEADPAQLLYGELHIGTNRWLLARVRPENRLFVDLNQNGDFTDDAGGTFTTDKSRRQSFTNVMVRAPMAGVIVPVVLDLEFPPRGSAGHASATLRSWFAGRLETNGKAWQVGFLPALDPGWSSAYGNRLVVRPWEKREEPFNWWETRPGWMRCDPDRSELKLFLQDTAFRLKLIASSQTPDTPFEVKLTPQQPKLGEARITGKSVELLSLEAASDNLVLLQQPGDTVRIPVATYRSMSVWLEHGTNAASGTFRETVKVAETGAVALAIGGPLTNTVSTRRAGRNLRLDYRLAGVGGKAYTLVGRESRQPPQFAVFKGERRLATGKFEFG